MQVLFYFGQTTQYVQAGLLSIGYFTTAWVAHTLAKYLVATEQLAAQREIDLANMAEVSQLVIQDMQDGVLVVDEHGVIRQHNARAEEMLGPLRRRRRKLYLQDYSPVAGAAARGMAPESGRRIRSDEHRRAEQQGERALRAGRPQPQRRRGHFSRGPDARPGAGAADETGGARPAHRQHRARNPQPAVGDQPRHRIAAGGAGAQRHGARDC